MYMNQVTVKSVRFILGRCSANCFKLLVRNCGFFILIICELRVLPMNICTTTGTTKISHQRSWPLGLLQTGLCVVGNLID